MESDIETRKVLFEKHNWFTETYPIIKEWNKAIQEKEEVESVKISGKLIQKVKEMGINFDDYWETLSNFAYKNKE